MSALATTVTAVDPTGAKSVGARRMGKQSRVIEVCEASCWGSVEVDPVVLRAVERLLDMGNEPALRSLKRLRKRTEQEF